MNLLLDDAVMANMEPQVSDSGLGLSTREEMASRRDQRT